MRVLSSGEVTMVAEKPVFAKSREESQVRHLDHALARTGTRRAALIGPSGEEIPVPDSVHEVLVEAVHALAHGLGVTVMPVGAELTTQQAADMLNVSRPHLVGLLEDGEIPFYKVGTHRRILIEDVENYKAKRDRERTSKLKRLSAEAQELGLYG